MRCRQLWRVGQTQIRTLPFVFSRRLHRWPGSARHDIVGKTGDRQMSGQDVFTKAAWRLIPFMMLLYIVNYVDRVNVGFAALTMNKDLAFSPGVFGFGAG